MNKLSGKRLIKLGLLFSLFCFIYMFFLNFNSQNDFSRLVNMQMKFKISMFLIFIVISLFLGFLFAGILLTTNQPKFKFKRKFVYKGMLIGLVWMVADATLVNSGKFLIIPMIIDFIIGTFVGMLIFNRKASNH